MFIVYHPFADYLKPDNFFLLEFFGHYVSLSQELLINTHMEREEVDSKLSQWYLSVRKYSELGWNWNASLQFPILSRYLFQHRHIKAYTKRSPI